LIIWAITDWGTRFAARFVGSLMAKDDEKMVPVAASPTDADLTEESERTGGHAQPIHRNRVLNTTA
jgi:hypothetical protein